MGWEKVGEDNPKKYVAYMHFTPEYAVGDIIQTENEASPKFIKVAKGTFLSIED